MNDIKVTVAPKVVVTATVGIQGPEGVLPLVDRQFIAAAVIATGADADQTALDRIAVESATNTVVSNLAAINTVAGDIANVNTVAGAIANVDATGGSIANVNAVANDLTNINAVQADLANINTVAPHVTAIETNATNIIDIQNAEENANAAIAAKEAAEAIATALASVDGSTSKTLTNVEVTNTIISDVGMTGAVDLQLPTAAAGMNFLLQCGCTDTSLWRIRAGATDKIYLNGVAGADHGYVGLSTHAIGAYLAVWSIQTAAGVWDWNAVVGSGNWLVS